MINISSKFLISILVITLFWFSSITLSIGKHNMENIHYGYKLFFQENEFNVPKNNYYEIDFDLKDERFSEFKKIDDFDKQEYAIFNLAKLPESTIQWLQSLGEIVMLNDISPDKEWMSISYKTKYTETKNRIIFINQPYLLNIKRHVIDKKLDLFSFCYFSYNSKYCFLQEGWAIKRMDLHTGEVINFNEATSHFINLEKDRLILFNKGKIWVQDINNKELEYIGNYNDMVYASGVIDKKWGYYLTTPSSKGGFKKLFFINLVEKKILKYSQKLPEIRLIRIVKIGEISELK